MQVQAAYKINAYAQPYIMELSIQLKKKDV